MSWRLHAEELFNKYFQGRDLSKLNSVYMFGVYTGESVWDIVNIFNRAKKDVSYFLFDSFVGLPKEEKEVIAQECWNEGDFSTAKALEVSSVEEAMNKVEGIIRKNCEPKKLSMIPGFFCDSLTENLIEEKHMGPALYVDVDVDLYSSTIDSLDWMFRNGLIVPGTIIGYDDWGGTPGWFVNADGESRAHKELCKKYNVECLKVFQAGSRFPHVHTMFLVKSIG